MPCEEDDHGIWIYFGKGLEKRHAVKSGHDKIGNDHGRSELRRFFKGIIAIDGLLDLVAPARQQIGQACTCGLVVVRYENPVFHSSLPRWLEVSALTRPSDRARL